MAAMWSSPAARATSIPRWIEWIHDEQEYGDDDPSRPQYRQAADNSKPSVHGFFCKIFAIRDRDRNSQVRRGQTILVRFVEQRIADHRPWPRIDRRFADRQGQPSTRDCADALSRSKADARCRRCRRHLGNLSRAPWVTSGSSPASFTIPARQRPSRISASVRPNCAVPPRGSRIDTGSGKRPVAQRRIGSAGGRRGAGAGSPAAAQRLGSFDCHLSILAKPSQMTKFCASATAFGEGRH